jgi:hypothetical protein
MQTDTPVENLERNGQNLAGLLLKTATGLANAVKRDEEDAKPLYDNEGFARVNEAVCFLKEGANALKGIGSMLLTEDPDNNETLEWTSRSDASDVFSFFGKALYRPADEIFEAADLLRRIASKRGI